MYETCIRDSFKPAPHIMQAMQDACKDPENYKYSLTDLPELIEAVQYRYEKRFGVQLEPDEVMSVYGSQEGMAHIGLVLCNQGESILVPNPGYPLFEMSGIMAGATVETYKMCIRDRDNMYATVIDEEDFAIKPMNCPGGILVYQSEPRSYRDLPLRMGELGLVCLLYTSRCV